MIETELACVAKFRRKREARAEFRTALSIRTAMNLEVKLNPAMVTSLSRIDTGGCVRIPYRKHFSAMQAN